MGRVNLERNIDTESTTLNSRASQYFDLICKIFLNKKAFEDQRKLHKDIVLLIVLFANNILLIALLIGSIVTSYAQDYKGISPLWILGLLILGVILHIILKLGLSNTSAILLVFIYLIGPSYASFHWGIELPMALLGFVLAIALAGSLMSSKHGIYTSILITLIASAIGWLQINNVLSPISYWKDEMVGQNDVWEIIVILLVITLVLWLSHYQTERMFLKNKELELALQQEKETLAKRIENKTREIESLAVIGKETAGILHDINQPLTVLKICADNLEKTEITEEIKESITCIEEYVKTIKNSLKSGINKHSAFQPRNIINRTLKLFKYRSIKHNISVEIRDETNLTLYGNETMFERAMMNIISNAFDACEENKEINPSEDNSILISIEKKDNFCEIKIEDTGIKIPCKILQTIFSNRYTTKSHGSGIGISVVRQIINEHFNGTINVKQNESHKEFKIQIPLFSNRRQDQ